MKMMTFEKFAEYFGKAGPNAMDMSIYRDSFQCACGRAHWFDESIEIICQGFMKVMVTCPVDPTYITSLKIKTFMMVKFKGFDSLAGSHISTEEDALAFAAIRHFMSRR